MKKLVAITFLGTILTGCNWGKFNNQDDLRNNYVGESAFTEMTNMTDQAIDGNLVYYKGKQNCATITIDTSSNPKVIVIDFGTTNCLCDDGKNRRGAIVTTFTGPYGQTGTVITHTPQDYYVNDYKVEGTKVVTNNGNDGNGNPYFTVDIDGTITKPTGEVFTYMSDRVRTWVQGHDTPLNIFDDEYTITGTASGTNDQGGSYSINTVSPVYYIVGCKYPVSGQLNIDLSSLNHDIGVDYGNGNCDWSFVATYRGRTYTIFY
ncbi:MAG: hypothetical protein R2799_04065 [Crocinitomicaceae bacterium]